jgi:hypothetical protein
MLGEMCEDVGARECAGEGEGEPFSKIDTFQIEGDFRERSEYDTI